MACCLDYIYIFNNLAIVVFIKLTKEENLREAAAYPAVVIVNSTKHARPFTSCKSNINTVRQLSTSETICNIHEQEISLLSDQ